MNNKNKMADQEYRPLLSAPESDGEEDDTPPPNVSVNSGNDRNGNRWSRIDNLDKFFKRVYEFFVYQGFLAFALEKIMSLCQFLFIVFFAAFLITTLRWDQLFGELDYEVVHLKDNVTVIKDASLADVIDLERLHNVHPIVIILLLVAMVAWSHRCIKNIWAIYKFWEIRNFYKNTLKISLSELRDFTWPDVVERLKKVQINHRLIIQKRELNELEDVYHRILRFTNYEVALINKAILPTKLYVPFYGEKVFLTGSLMYNYRFLLFHGPRAVFKDSFSLRDEYRDGKQREEVARKLRNFIAIVALVNLIFSPLIFFYQILVSFFTYGELVKHKPGTFGTRRWSEYGRLYLRHYNELEHDLNMRLCTSYEKASFYISHFHSPVLAVLAKHIAFIAGGLFAVLLVLTVIQEGLITAPYILTSISLLGIIVTTSRMFIPEESSKGTPKQLMLELRNHLHYIPDDWLMKPHTTEVQKEFTQVFQYTVVYILDELLSPLITPFVLYFKLRPKALDIVNFFRQFTIEVSGVGSVCSYAEMSVQRHGHPGWSVFPDASMPRPTQIEQAELGKTEMSLVNFKSKHPKWKPGETEANFLSNVSEATQSLMTSFTPGDPDQSLLFRPTRASAGLHPLSNIQSIHSNDWAVLSMTQSGAVNVDEMTVLSHLHDQHMQRSREEGQVSIRVEEPRSSSQVPSWGLSTVVRHFQQPPAPAPLTAPLLQPHSSQSLEEETITTSMVSGHSLPPLEDVTARSSGGSLSGSSDSTTKTTGMSDAPHKTDH